MAPPLAWSFNNGGVATGGWYAEKKKCDSQTEITAFGGNRGSMGWENVGRFLSPHHIQAIFRRSNIEGLSQIACTSVRSFFLDSLLFLSSSDGIGNNAPFLGRWSLLLCPTVLRSSIIELWLSPVKFRDHKTVLFSQPRTCGNRDHDGHSCFFGSESD